MIIEAYTNDMKSEEENLKLSQTRAEAVKDYLVSKGFSPERFKAEGLSVSKPEVQDKVKSRHIRFYFRTF